MIFFILSVYYIMVEQYHYRHLQKILSGVLEKSVSSSKTLILTTRAYQIVTAILTEAQIFQCGYTRILSSSDINMYMQYEDVVLVLSTSSS